MIWKMYIIPFFVIMGHRDMSAEGFRMCVRPLQTDWMEDVLRMSEKGENRVENPATGM